MLHIFDCLHNWIVFKPFLSPFQWNKLRFSCRITIFTATVVIVHFYLLWMWVCPSLGGPHSLRTFPLCLSRRIPEPFLVCTNHGSWQSCKSGFLAFSSTFLKSVLCFSHVGRKILSAASESFLKLLHNIPINCRLSGASSASEDKVGAQIFTGTNFVHHISYDIFPPYGLPSHLSRRTRIRFCCRYAWTFR